MKQGFWQRLIKHGGAPPPRPGTRGTTVVWEERGSGAGAVLFRPYAVSEFIPDAATAASSPPEPASRTVPSCDPAPVDAMPQVDAPEDVLAAGARVPNPVADDWRRGNPDLFRTVARRFCARAPVVARELREFCLTEQRPRLVRLAASLKPTLGLYDMTAANAAERVEHGAAASAADLAREVLALENEVWRVAYAWQHVDQVPAAPLGETS